MRKIVLFILLLAIVSLACGTSDRISEEIQGGSENDTKESQPPATQEGFQADFGSGPADLGNLAMSLAKLGSFAARFEISFEGDTDWLYQVVTRHDGKRTEYTLHIEGVEADQNPGDVRLVNVNGVNRMKGPGTEEKCVQFPDEMETGLLFLTPADFIDLQDFTTEWKEKDTVTIADREATTYQAREKEYRGWEKVDVEYAVDAESEAILSFSFEAKGPDPLFGYGEGKITGQFTVFNIGYLEVKPVGGCKPPYPLPEDATDLIVLPGVSSFQTSMGPVKLSQFFGQKLLKGDWKMLSSDINDQTREGWLVYSNGALQLTVHIEANDTEDFSKGFLIKVYEEAPE